MDPNPHTGTAPVPPRHRFDVAALEHHLRSHLPGFAGPLEVEQFKGGQSNPTYRLHTPAADYVLRRKPPGVLLPSAHAVEREHRVMSALRDSPVPVPRTLLMCPDATVIGTPFYVMELVAGRILWDPALPGMSAGERTAIYDSMNAVLGALHRLDPATLGLGDYGRPGNFFERQIARWTAQYRASQTEPIDAMERLIEWLPAQVPPDRAAALVHGDYRLDNLVFHATQPRVVAVLDWELSTLGHPMADFSYHALSWELPPGALRGLQGLELGNLGIPSLQTHLQRYCERAQIDCPTPAQWRFYVAYNLFRGAAISQGILRRALDGSASSAHALQAGQLAQTLAEQAWQRVVA